MHKGFLSGEDWIKIQRLLKMNENKRYRKPRTNTALLTGILRCENCGSYMRPKIQTGRLNSNGETKYSYICELKLRSRRSKCNSKNIDGNKLDAELIKVIKNIIVPNSKICYALKKIMNTKKVTNENGEERKHLQYVLQKNQKELEALIQKIKYIDVELIDNINQEMKAIKKENEEIKRKLKEYKDGKKIETSTIDVYKLVLEIIEKHFEQFESLDIVEKRNCLRMLIDSAEAESDNIKINLLSSNSADFFKPYLFPTGEDRQ